MQFDVTILGCNGAIPAYGRHPSAQVVNHNGQLYLLDCGEGTQFRMNQYGIKRGRLDHIFITHLHGDHFFGLIALLTSFNLNWRTHPLHLFGPAELYEIIQLHFKHSKTELKYELCFHPLSADKPALIHEDKHITVETVVLKHRLPTTGFILREKAGLRRILPEKIKEYNIPYQLISGIKEGADFTDETGLIIPNSELTHPPAPPRSYAYCTDTAYHPDITEQLQQVSTLFHEATFTEEHTERAAETYHSTSKQAASIAKSAGVQKLIVGHFSARYENLQPLLAECRETFPETYLAEEGKVFAI